MCVCLCVLVGKGARQHGMSHISVSSLSLHITQLSLCYTIVYQQICRDTVHCVGEEQRGEWVGKEIAGFLGRQLGERGRQFGDKVKNKEQNVSW